MNSVVQLLSHVKELRAYFTVGSWQEDLNLTSFLGYGGRVATGWHNIVSQLWNGSTTVHAPHGFKSVIDALGLGFDGTNMHDAAELLNIVIGALDEDTNKITNKTYVKNKDIDGSANRTVESKLAWEAYALNNCSIITDTFMGQKESSMTCPKCNHTSVSYDAFSSLMLPIPMRPLERTGVSLDACFEEHAAAENDVEWKCPICQENVAATKTTAVTRLPDVLVVSLNRFNNDGYKIETLVEYPLDGFDMAPHCAVNSNGTKKLYDLVGVSNHYNRFSPAIRKHYTTSCRDQLGEPWWLMNDAKIELYENPQEVVSNAGYILVYQARTTIVADEDAMEVEEDSNNDNEDASDEDSENDFNDEMESEMEMEMEMEMEGDGEGVGEEEERREGKYFKAKRACITYMESNCS